LRKLESVIQFPKLTNTERLKLNLRKMVPIQPYHSVGLSVSSRDELRSVSVRGEEESGEQAERKLEEVAEGEGDYAGNLRPVSDEGKRSRSRLQQRTEEEPDC
jgi:hypothetical protein